MIGGTTRSGRTPRRTSLSWTRDRGGPRALVQEPADVTGAEVDPKDRVEEKASVWLVGLVVALSTGAGAVHLAEANHHFAEWWWAGVFFVAVAAAQLAFAPLFLLPSTRPAFAVLGIVGNLAVIGVYVMSRTTGVPVGWHRWTPEQPGILDVSTTLVELALVLILLAFVSARQRRWLVNLLCLCGVAAWTLRAAGMLT